jgi:uncharacterized metal-binding protein YceD (DUF177 family)
MKQAPLSRLYNLGRLGQTGDEISFHASEEERAELAKTVGLLEVPNFSAHIALKKISPTNFEIAYRLGAEIVQACVVTLEPLAASIARVFTRELHYTPNLRRPAEKEVIVVPGDDELPEEIGSLHFDLAGPLMEEFLLAIDPYPRAPGVEFSSPSSATAPPDSPFAVLKDLKSRG